MQPEGKKQDGHFVIAPLEANNKLCWVELGVMPHLWDGVFQYAFVQAAAAKKKQLCFRQSQAQHWHLLLSHQ